jgi:protein-S-isoprenylcysteine O-methyltransferase Ste14
MKQKHFIDIHKGATGPMVLLLIWYFNQWENPTAWIYLALHGSYGIMWILKSLIFPDKTWEAKCTFWYGLYIWGGLTLYWISPFIIMSSSIYNSPIYLGILVFMFSMGIFFHYAADMQKHVHLKLKPGQLIRDGLMSRCRNTNYFGELLIYLSFALMSKHWMPIAVLISFLIIIWLPNMRRKEKSLSRYPDYEEYRNRSFLLIPFIW